MTTNLWISRIAMFAVLVYSTIGRKPFNIIRILLPIVLIGYFGATYLKEVPTGGNNGWLLVAASLLGAVAGAVLVFLTRTEFDSKTGITYVTSNFASIAVLSFVFILRIVLIEMVTLNGEEAFVFSIEHHFDLEVLGPIFILMAGAMITV
ncbi:CcdC protein domain-containing protein [Paenibacillus xylanexedens]|uniref:CcdC protein domain-containing protein n=1 Tax=Paenibacillus xylanexedens TaxID=528191 RepID=UPI000F5329CA|nr:CcdC protein domain-containing protein [Paenibacillus xylanexedens]RPK31474.1 hypothetical protein EDO6_02101 [Paenibacillus xylanexedens]